MDSAAKIFAYCERGLDPSFWAEPFNAITNAGFIIGALFALRELAMRPSGERKLVRYLLVLNVFVIGIGSFLFHTYATPWASAADVIPIGIFMLAYLGYALIAFVGLHWLLALPAIALFAWVIEQAMQVQCDALGLSLPLLEKTNCLNGSFGYLPALAAMLMIGAWLTIRRHPTAPYVLGASLIFMISVTFRATDRIWCNNISFMDKAIGTHFLWHTCNSIVLFLLVMAAVRHGAPGAVPANRRQAA